MFNLSSPGVYLIRGRKNSEKYFRPITVNYYN